MVEESPKKKNWITCAIVLVILLCLLSFIILGSFAIKNIFNDGEVQQSISLDQDPTSQPLDKNVPYEAVVQILALYEEQGELLIGWSGSGSIISPDGLILTNAHVVLSDRYFNVDALAVAITVGEDRPPEVLYFAEVLQADEALDIAVIQITTDIDDNPVNISDLNLPYVVLGDSGSLRLGDEISILGYPSIGGETITFTTGEVSGFTPENPYGNRAFIKTSATIAGGNSGGLAADSQGRLIGIPTQLGYGGDGQFVDCRVLEDTNRDGVVDEDDSCIPTGGFINALRPIRLALPLIEAARDGQVAIITIEAVVEEMVIPVSGSILFEDDFSDPNSGWGAQEGDYGSVGYVDGQLQIKIIPDSYNVWTTPEKLFNGVIISVDINVIDPVGDSEFGILCGYQDVENFFSLVISEDGYFAIWKYVDGEYFPVADWQTSSLISQGSGPHTVYAACFDKTLALGVDGELLVEITDPDFSYGDVGLLVGTWENPGVIIGFDNFVVTDYVP